VRANPTRVSELTPARVQDAVLAVFVPGRRGLGALATALRKHGLQYLEDWPGPTLRARYAGREGFCLTLAGFAALPAGKGRHTLPPPMVSCLYEIVADIGENVEFTLLLGGDDAPKTGSLTADTLGQPVAAGCRYSVSPPAPQAKTIPGRPEVEGWTRREP
jgi:hypothetical protein